MSNTMKYLVLGANGFIGKNLLMKLAEHNTVIAFDRVFSGDFIKHRNVITCEGDFTALESFDNLLENVDCVIHLISTTVPSDITANIPLEIEKNIIPTVKLLESMVRKNVKKIIFASSAGAFYGETGDRLNTSDSAPNPYCSYGVQKAVIEQYLRFYGVRYNIDYRIMRISNPYGCGQDPKKVQGLIPIFLKRLIVSEAISIYGDGNNLRDYIYVPDLIDGIISVLNYSGNVRTFNLGLGEYYTINQVIEMIEYITGLKFTKIIHEKARFCDVVSSIVDMSTSHRELEWMPKTRLHEGILETYNKIKKQRSI